MKQRHSWELTGEFWEAVQPLIPQKQRDPAREYRRKQSKQPIGKIINLLVVILISRRKPQSNRITAACARKKAEQRRLENKPCPKTGNTALMGEVKERFKDGWSAEQIAGRLAQENPEKQISHETIYRYVYGELEKEPEMKDHFRHPRLKRKNRPAGKDQRGQIPDRISIEERPALVDEKVRVGDWEGGVGMGVSP